MRDRSLIGTLALVLLMAAVLSGCRQDMHDQAKFEPLEATNLFPDGSSARQPVEGTVARGELREDPAVYRGETTEGEALVDIPVPIDRELLERGRQRYDIFCSPCHDRGGDGLGMIVRRGFKQPTSFHDPRLRTAPAGYFFSVMTNGFGEMSSYAALVPVEDRWAITAYIRALQLSRNVSAVDLPADALAKIEDTKASLPETHEGS